MLPEDDDASPASGAPGDPGPRHGDFAPGEFARLIHELRARAEDDVRPDEGLRERKKRLTRQLISDTATWMFVERGFDAVRVAEVAAAAGVSEKTVFNYFPTKESLVLDREEEIVAGIRDAIVDRRPGTSPTQAMVEFIEEETRSMGRVGDEFPAVYLAFLNLVMGTPALRTAFRALTSKLVDAVREALAESAGVDPHDPEPYVAAKALVSLWELQLHLRKRHLRDGASFDEVIERNLAETRRAARLLDTGLWSFHSMAQWAGSRDDLADATRAASEARAQVVEALRQARGAWMAAQRASRTASTSFDVSARNAVRRAGVP
ncbi:TetR/AcrR family transcriptional regulator, partial [Patulibacter sp. S7RM1-6]